MYKLESGCTWSSVLAGYKRSPSSVYCSSNPNTDHRFNSRMKYSSQAAQLTYTRRAKAAMLGDFSLLFHFLFLQVIQEKIVKGSNVFTVTNNVLISGKVFHPSRRHSAVLGVIVLCFPFRTWCAQGDTLFLRSCIQLTDHEHIQR